MPTWVTEVLAYGKQYPELAAIAIGMLLSWAPGLILEQWFLPLAWDERHTKQVSLTVTVISALIVSAVVWHALDATDSRSLVIVVSFFAAIGAPFVHIWIAGWLDKHVSWFNSVFTRRNPQEPSP